MFLILQLGLHNHLLILTELMNNYREYVYHQISFLKKEVLKKQSFHLTLSLKHSE